MTIVLTLNQRNLNKNCIRFQFQHNIQAWKVKLFYKRGFRESDRICERHFDQSQIITHWDYMINGKLCKLERDKPKLESQAVPYLNLPDVATTVISPVKNETDNSPSTARKRRKLINSPVLKVTNSLHSTTDNMKCLT